MAVLDTNVFPITNLRELSSRYRLVEVAGLHPDQAEYFQNRQILERKLSYTLRKPVAVIERDGIPFVVVPEEVSALPADVPLVRVVVQLKPGETTFDLDYTRRTPETDAIALRFLRFLIQAPLYADRRLWQPASGRPFFPRTPDRTEGGIHCYVGFAVRPVVTPDGGLGLCVDVVSGYVGARALPSKLTRDDFVRSWKGRKCIYHFGEKWYEIRLHALDDRTVSQYRFVKDGKTWILIDYVLDQVSRPLALDLANLAEDAAVGLYMDNRGNELAAPMPLCYPVFDTSSEQVAQQHRRAILAPHERRELTHSLVEKYLRALKFGDTAVRLAEQPLRIPQRTLEVPDLRFGQGVVLSVRGTAGAIHTDLDELGNRRLMLLKDRAAGFYSSAPLDRQYLFLPRSVHDTFGPQFIGDLAATVGEFFPQDGGYSPIIVPYDDRGQRTFVRQALALRAAAEAACRQPGYALVMVHHPVDRRDRDEDQLAAMVVRELRERWDVRTAVIHSEITTRAYREVQGDDGRLHYQCAPEQWRRLAGYLRNVATSKVLLTNQRWPFVLATPLHAEVTVGVDVKHHTCGLLVVGNRGSDIRSELRTSRQKERLLASQMAKYLFELLRKEAEAQGKPIAAVVVHRDGRIEPSEVQGIRQALQQLRAAGHLADGFRYAVMEISKSSPTPLRLYDVRAGDHGRPFIRNPRVGTMYRPGDREAYLCTTGRPFLRQGTAHPLHVRMVDGTLPFDQCLEDLYALTVLSWTQPEGCMRYPITIKLNDRILAAEAGEYDVDAIEFAGEAANEDIV